LRSSRPVGTNREVGSDWPRGSKGAWEPIAEQLREFVGKMCTVWNEQLVLQLLEHISSV